MSSYIIAINTGDYWDAGDSIAHAEALLDDLVDFGVINESKDEPEIIDLDEEE